jgi:uncharacterized protein YajQ (UPF0234 family)
VAQSYSFDVVAEVDMNEVQVEFRGCSDRPSGIRADWRPVRCEQEFTVLGDDEFKLKAAIDILQGRLVKRGVSLKSLNYQKVEPASGGAVRQKIKIQSGIEKERCKEIVKEIKAMKIKVQAQIQDAQVRVSSAKKDLLQEVMEHLRNKDYDFHIDFDNYR